MAKDSFLFFVDDELFRLGIKHRGYEIIGRKENQCLCIKSNGNIQLNDSLMVCGNGFTQTGLNISSVSFSESLKHPIMYEYYYAHSDFILCKKCNSCLIKEICGGGHLAHRYSVKNLFNNPSAYCTVLFNIISHIQNAIVQDVFSKIDNTICKINNTDLE